MAQTTETVNGWVRTEVERRNLPKARELVDNMLAQHGCRPDATSLNLLLSGYVATQQEVAAHALLESFPQRHGLVPGEDSVQILLEPLLNAERLEEAVGLATNYHVAGILFFDATVDLLVKAYEKKSGVHKAAEMLPAIRSGLGASCSRVRAAAMVRALIGLGEVEMARDMVLKDTEPPAAACVASLVEQLVEEEELVPATHFAAQVWAKFKVGCGASALTKLVRAYVKAEKLDFAERLIFAMEKAYGVRPPSFACNLLVDGLCKAGDPLRGLSVADRMASEALVAPTPHTICRLINGLAQSGRMEQAEELLGSMQEKYGLEEDLVCVNALVSALVRNKQLGKAEAVIGALRMQPAARTYSPLVTLAVRRKDLGRLEHVLGLMKARDVVPDSFLYTRIVQAYLQAGDVESARQKYDEMRRNGVNLEAKSKHIVAQLRLQDRRSAPDRRGPPGRSPPRRSPPRRSPPRRMASPPRRMASPPRRMASPPRRMASPPRRMASPPRRMASPPRRMASPPRRMASPPRRSPPRRPAYGREAGRYAPYGRSPPRRYGRSPPRRSPPRRDPYGGGPFRRSPPRRSPPRRRPVTPPRMQNNGKPMRYSMYHPR